MYVDLTGWLDQHKTSIVGGIALAVVAAIVAIVALTGRLVRRRFTARTQTQQSGPASTNLQAGGNITYVGVPDVVNRQNHPHLSFERWGEIPENHPLAMPTSPSGGAGLGARASSPPIRSVLQRGFYLVNDGSVAFEVQVCRFEVESSVWATSKAIPRIAGAGGQEFAFIWLENVPIGKWDLLNAMSTAAEKQPASALYGADYTVKVSVIYRDMDNHWYRGAADMSFIKSQGRIRFGATSRENLGISRPTCP